MNTMMRMSLVALISVLGAGCGNDGDSAAAAAGLPAGARFLTDDTSCSAPRCFEIDVPVPDDVHVTDTRVRVLVPADYTTSDQRYPLLTCCTMRPATTPHGPVEATRRL
ncbi:MAG: hypothetical protein M3O62_18190 [Pseudomonadota bacterium]|nr:hypothetical protein [Pseudomonadota bacterium]